MLPGVPRLSDSASTALVVAISYCLVTVASCRSRQASIRQPHHLAVVESFTEATSVFQIVSAPPYAFAATAVGLDQWDLRSGLRVAPSSPLFRARISDLAYDKTSGALWLVTDDGIVRYNVETKKTRSYGLPDHVAGSALTHAVIEPRREGGGGVYLGLGGGLFVADDEGHWSATAVRSPVTDVLAMGNTVFVGSVRGVFALDTNLHGPVRSFACQLAAVNQLLRAPGGGVLAIGVADAGAPRVAYLDSNGVGCESFRVSPEAEWVDATATGEHIVILTVDSIHLLSRASRVQRRSGQASRLSRRKNLKLRRTGMTLIPITALGSRVSSDKRLRTSLGSLFTLDKLDAIVPPGAQTVAISGGEVLVGTRSLGTARISLHSVDSGIHGGDVSRSRWLRREELTDGAIALTVSCLEPTNCRLANGGGTEWNFDGDRFSRQDLTQYDGAVAVSRFGERSLRLRWRASTTSLSTPLSGAAQSSSSVVELFDSSLAPVAALRVPNDFRLMFLRPAGTGMLFGWSRPHPAAERSFGDFDVLIPLLAPLSPLLGPLLRPLSSLFVDSHGFVRGRSAERNEDSGNVLSLVQWVSLDDRDNRDSAVSSSSARTIGVGGAPMRDVVGCAGRLYAATDENIYDVSGDVVESVSGLGADQLMCAQGKLHARRGATIRRLDGDDDTTLLVHDDLVRDAVVGADGRIFLATRSGLGIWDGQRVRHYDRRRGLIDDDIRDIEMDRFGRIWLLTATSIGLFQP